MEARFQFRVDSETKPKLLAQDEWLAEQLNQAFAKLESGDASFVDNQTAQARMAGFKNKIRNRGTVN